MRATVRSAGAIARAARVPMRSMSAAARIDPAVVAARPFTVIGLQQVAVGGLDKERLRTLWVDLLGLRHVLSFESERENVNEDVLQLGEGPSAVEVDIMQPMDASKSPKVHSPPLNHIGLWVDDLPTAVEWLEKQGVRFTPSGIRKGAGGHDVCFVHPKGNEASPLCGEGVLIELVQAPQSVIDWHRETLASAGRA